MYCSMNRYKLNGGKWQHTGFYIGRTIHDELFSDLLDYATGNKRIKKIYKRKHSLYVVYNDETKTEYID